MYIAQAKRKENIAEYILYLWQLEDLLRALRFSPEAIWSQLVAPQIPGDEERQNNLLMWYMDVGSLLREEGKEKTGTTAPPTPASNPNCRACAPCWEIPE